MNKVKVIESLMLFNEKVDELISSGFVKHLQQEKGLKVTSKFLDNAPCVIIHNLPGKDAVNAFVLNLRFFCQDNERSSLRNIAKLYKEIVVSSEIKKNLMQLEIN